VSQWFRHLPMEFSMDLTVLMTFLTKVLALSVGVERITEIFKNTVYGFIGSHKVFSQVTGPFKAAGLQLLAGLIGSALVLAIGPQTFLPDMSGPAAVVLLGALASGGSAMWNHAIDIIGAVKDVKEKVAADTIAKGA
jgi:hypothetical protein